MGLYSTATISADAVKLCVFDLRRGQREGDEVEKILFFYPSEVPLTEQLSVIGLSEGLITFTRIFSPDVACEVIEAERHSHVFYEVEPDIWMVMVVEKNRELDGIWRIEALRGMLKEVHSLFVMFNGSIRAMLDKESSGALVRSHLFSFITDYLFACQKRYPLDFCCWDLLAGKKLQLPSFRDSLQERGTVQMLTVGRDAAIEIQSLVRVLESCAGSAGCHSLVLFHDLLVSTSLCPDDTVNLYTYAVMRMSPRALSTSVSSWSYLRKGNSSAHLTTGSVLPTSSSSSERVQGSRDTSPSGDNRYLIARPLQQDKWSKGKDGFLVTNRWGSDMHASLPTVWLQQTKERMYLCAHQHKNVTIILLIPVTFINNADREIPVLKQQLLENASLKILKVEEKLSKGWGGENAYHVSGYRYLLVDGDRSVSRASPAAKAATLSKESLIAMCKLREEIDLEKSRTKGDDGNHGKDLELCIRAKNNAWVVARVLRGKELYVVLEKANETLLYASDAIEKFSNRYCNGAFS
ncbi:vacuolar fusion protein CCZ1 homolog B isoform X1 [Spinacia oleracea]|uniref:Vacuolar fusion protein CCZ1 homolog B isoform X1 n=1 Tax=Spinacia oleracea TaxID=3562 RepID=A0A9R0J393_SPIOL|nr:vacuolar fusion protein CCZ1 homolog B-like isoform X1 [Spinacia oleracea]XP_021860420.2 vacuolar fusion protein CCZ1 homolog B-like isoform X1 [Spinacia oleracea]XP_021860421.2 vacuolar fusion protein CCZ1 homolog B-like isoform X1 [Spinacia oleracea]